MEVCVLELIVEAGESSSLLKLRQPLFDVAITAERQEFHTDVALVSAATAEAEQPPLLPTACLTTKTKLLKSTQM